MRINNMQNINFSRMYIGGISPEQRRKVAENIYILPQKARKEAIDGLNSMVDRFSETKGDYAVDFHVGGPIDRRVIELNLANINEDSIIARYKHIILRDICFEYHTSQEIRKIFNKFNDISTEKIKEKETEKSYKEDVEDILNALKK